MKVLAPVRQVQQARTHTETGKKATTMHTNQQGKRYTTPGKSRFIPESHLNTRNTLAPEHFHAGVNSLRTDRTSYAGLRSSSLNSSTVRRQGRAVFMATPNSRTGSMSVRGSSNPSSAPGASVHHMLNDLVELSKSIAAILDQETYTPSPSKPSGLNSSVREQASLKAQEIERVVRRVEVHFIGRIKELEEANRKLQLEVKQLKLQIAEIGTSGSANGVRSPATSIHTRSGLAEEVDAAAAELDVQRHNGERRVLTSSSSDLDNLRHALVAEKRQRLRVEEQTQQLTEEHAKVVGTLERRLKKQEDQLYDLIAAVDRGPSTTSLSPSRNAERSTPRRLLHQQLAHHQQTQRELQQYKEQLRGDLPPSLPNETTPGASALTPDDVHRTLEMIKVSKPPVVSSLILRDPVAPTVAPPRELVTADAMPRFAAAVSEVDEITSFLDSITKELESIDTV